MFPILKNNVLKIGLDQLVRPIVQSIGHKTGSIQCKKPFFDKTGQESDEPMIKPMNRSVLSEPNDSLPQFYFFSS